MQLTLKSSQKDYWEYCHQNCSYFLPKVHKIKSQKIKTVDLTNALSWNMHASRVRTVSF